jgi:hypothetical protein
MLYGVHILLMQENSANVHPFVLFSEILILIYFDFKSYN